MKIENNDNEKFVSVPSSFCFIEDSEGKCMLGTQMISGNDKNKEYPGVIVTSELYPGATAIGVPYTFVTLEGGPSQRKSSTQRIAVSISGPAVFCKDYTFEFTKENDDANEISLKIAEGIIIPDLQLNKEYSHFTIPIHVSPNTAKIANSYSHCKKISNIKNDAPEGFLDFLASIGQAVLPVVKGGLTGVVNAIVNMSSSANQGNDEADINYMLPADTSTANLAAKAAFAALEKVHNQSDMGLN